MGCFSPAKTHFSMHAMDFEYIALLEAIEEIIKRKSLSVYGK